MDCNVRCRVQGFDGGCKADCIIQVFDILGLRDESCGIAIGYVERSITRPLTFRDAGRV